MKTTEFNKEISSTQINENMFKKFGVKLNFNKYTREELENYRNLLRTKIDQTEKTTQFNELLSHESYQKDKFMLNLLNTRIKEMLGENKQLSEKAVSKAQQQAAGIALAAKRSGKAPKKGTASAELAKMDTKELKKFAKTKHKGLPAKKTEESAKPDFLDMDKDGNKKEPMKKALADKKKAPFKKVKEATKKLVGGQKKLDTDKDGDIDAKDMKNLRTKKKVKEGKMIGHYKAIIEGLQQFIREDEEGKAKDITAGTDMVNDFTSWMQRVGQYQTKSMIELADSIRSNFGQAEADAFKAAVQPALEEALAALTQSRETLTRAVAVLAGEEGAMTPMGMDAGMEPGATDTMNEPAMEPTDDMSTEPAGDEFGASDAAAGGEMSAGRGMRESREQSRLRVIAEQHSIISRLAK